MPVMPHKPAGWRIEPPVSVPIDIGAMRAATLAADPPLEPPAMHCKFHGLHVVKNAEFSLLPPIANSSMFVLPISTASASRSLRMTVASYGGRKSLSIFEAQVVVSPLVHSRSLMAIGRPAS